MTGDQKRLPARFYKNQNGREPVREWLSGLKQERDRKIIGADIKTVEFGWPIGMPTIKKTQTIPKKDLDIARARQKEVEQ